MISAELRRASRYGEGYARNILAKSVGFNVATPITSPWAKQEIPNEDLLYMRVHKNHIDRDGKIAFIAFRNHGDPKDPSKEPGMSTDWQEYSTAEECRQRAKDINKDLDKYEVIQ